MYPAFVFHGIIGCVALLCLWLECSKESEDLKRFCMISLLIFV